MAIAKLSAKLVPACAEPAVWYTPALVTFYIWYRVMNNKRLSRLVFALLLSLPLLTACGQKGDLYLPATSTTYTPHDKA